MGENTGVITGVITLTQTTTAQPGAIIGSASDSSTTTTTTTSTATTNSSGSSSMSKDEVDRLIADISNAVQSSSLLSLLRSDVDEATQLQLPFSSFNKKRHHHHQHHHHRKKRNKSPPLSTYKCLADIPQSTLVDRMRPIRQALERIDAQRLLDLELMPFSSPEQAVQGPRLKDG